MREDLANELYAKYPELFTDNRVSLDVGDGWYVLLDGLFGLLCAEFRKAKKKYDEDSLIDNANELAGEQLYEFEHLPAIKQIKEKFGSLRFYAGTFRPEHKAYIDFAETMSSSICSNCGKMGSIQLDKGWLNCQCGECRKAAEETHFHG